MFAVTDKLQCAEAEGLLGQTLTFLQDGGG